MNDSSQFIHGFGHMTCTSRHQTLGIMVPPTDAYRPQPCRLGHLHIEGGIADEDRILGLYPGRGKRLKQHRGMRLRRRRVCRLNVRKSSAHRSVCSAGAMVSDRCPVAIANTVSAARPNS